MSFDAPIKFKPATLFKLAQHKPLVGKVEQYLELLVQSKSDDANSACGPYMGLYLGRLGSEGNADRLVADFYGMLVQVNIVETDKWVEVGNGTEVFFRIRDRLGEVVCDAGSRIEKDVTVNAVDVHCDNDPCGAINVMHGQSRDGVVYRKVVAQVCNGQGFFLIVEKDLVLCKKLHSPEFVYVSIKRFACAF